MSGRASLWSFRPHRVSTGVSYNAPADSPSSNRRTYRRCQYEMVFAASRGTAIALALLVSEVVVLADLGFGTFRKRKLTLEVATARPRPAGKYQHRLQGQRHQSTYQSVLQTLQATLETELIGNERSLVKKTPGEAEWTLDARVTSYSVPRAVRRTQRTGTATTTFVKYRGTLAVAYQVLDRTGRVHAADNVSTAYEQEFDAANPVVPGKPLFGVLPTVGTGTAPRSEEDVTQILIRDLVQKVAASLGNTIQPIEAQVAAGDDAMNRAADFMERRLWSRAIEEMEKAEPYKKPSDESYRLYNLGLAYEAMSYESKVYKEQRANLTQAQKLYDQAVEMNRAERYFVDVLRRVRDSIARYRELDAMEGAGKPASVSAAAPAPPPAPPPRHRPMR